MLKIKTTDTGKVMGARAMVPRKTIVTRSLRQRAASFLMFAVILIYNPLVFSWASHFSYESIEFLLAQPDQEQGVLYYCFWIITKIFGLSITGANWATTDTTTYLVILFSLSLIQIYIWSRLHKQWPTETKIVYFSPFILILLGIALTIPIILIDYIFFDVNPFS